VSRVLSASDRNHANTPTSSSLFVLYIEGYFLFALFQDNREDFGDSGVTEVALTSSAPLDSTFVVRDPSSVSGELIRND